MTKELEGQENSGSELLKWEFEKASINLPKLCENFFGIFLRTEGGNAIGGIIGNIEDMAQEPFGYIGAFFISDIMRGSGFSKALIEQAEKYILSRGMDLSVL